jgi:hypothetical protein
MEDINLGSEDFTVARLKRNLFSESTIGAIYTRRATGGTEGAPALPDRHTIGFDLDLFTSRFMGDKNLQFEAFYVLTSDATGEGVTTAWDRSARGIRINYPNDRWRAHTSFRELGGFYDPAVGFVRRNGFRRIQPTVEFRPRPESLKWVRQFRFEARLEYLTDLDNRLLTRNAAFRPLGILFESGDEIDFEVTSNFERLEEPFEIYPGVILPVGDYRFDEVELRFESAEKRRVSGEVEVRRGPFWSGDRTALELRFIVRPAAGVNVSLEWEDNHVDLEEGSFTTRVLQTEGQWHINPWASVTGIVQYDNVSQIAGLYTRLRWILTPGSDLFFVYTHNWLSELDRWITLERQGTTKINYTYRF